MADSRLNLLSWSLGVVVLSLSAQDVAVDAWAVELIPRRKLAYVAACQTIGMSAGNVLGHPLLLACPHDGHTLRRFCTAIASAHAPATTDKSAKSRFGGTRAWSFSRRRA